MVKVNLKDGVVKEYNNGITVLEIAKDISEGLARNACCALVNGNVEDLRFVVNEDCAVEICTFDTPEGKKALRHTASHIMAQAIKRLYPETKLAIGPSIDDGFYYDFDREKAFTQEELEAIEKEMKKIVKEDLPLERFELPREEAIKFMEEKEEPYKVELIKDLPEDAIISFYKQGEFTDLCAGPHLMSTKPVKAFKLMSVAGEETKKIKCFHVFTVRHIQRHQISKHILQCLKRQKNVITENSEKNLNCLLFLMKAQDSRSSFQTVWLLKIRSLIFGVKYTRKPDT